MQFVRFYSADRHLGHANTPGDRSRYTPSQASPRQPGHPHSQADAHAARLAGRDLTKAEGDAADRLGAIARGGPRLNLLLSWAGWQTDSVADRLPTFLEPMGIHSLRARSAREAERVIRSQPVHIAIVDLGLPMLDEPRHHDAPANRHATSTASADEAGPRLLELLRRLDTQPPTVVIKSSATRRDDHRQLGAALRSEAFAVVERAAADLELMLRILQRCLARHYADRWPGTFDDSRDDSFNDNPTDPGPHRTT